MNVAYAYEFSADDVTVQSGHPFFILGQLEKRINVQRVFPLDRRSKYAFAPKRLLNNLLGRAYYADREPLYLRALAAQVERRLQGRSVDALFVPSSNMIASLETALPMVFCADATFTQVLDSYEEYSNCSPDYLRRGHEQERRALARCAAAVYPSEWAARSAVADYGADPHKVHVIPFGANVSAPPLADIAAAVEAKPALPFRILFIGRDWKRKGGDIVLAACRIAHGRGVPLQLDFVGLDEIPEALPAFAVSHGLLKKSDPAQRQKFESLLRAAHLMFVPSRAECYGMTFCEAAAYGIPSLSTDVGGIPTIVRRGVTGFSLPVASPASAYAEVIERCHADRAAYKALALSSRRAYDAELNWDVFGTRLVSVFEQVSGQARRAA